MKARIALLAILAGVTGWLLFADTADQPAYAEPEFSDYGVASDKAN